MAFVVEDGTRKSDATAYITVDEFKDHHTDRGVSAISEGTWSDTEIQSGIINATDYVDKRFGRRFRGWRSTKTQALEWPRTDAYDDDDYLLDGIPNQLKKGIAEYALLVLQLGRNLAPVPGMDFAVTDPSSGETTVVGSGGLRRKTEKVDVIEDTTEYFSAGESHKPMTSTGNLTQQIPEYPQADLWIEELLRSYYSREIMRG